MPPPRFAAFLARGDGLSPTTQFSFESCLFYPAFFDPPQIGRPFEHMTCFRVPHVCVRCRPFSFPRWAERRPGRLASQLSLSAMDLRLRSLGRWRRSFCLPATARSVSRGPAFVAKRNLRTRTPSRAAVVSRTPPFSISTLTFCSRRRQLPPLTSSLYGGLAVAPCPGDPHPMTPSFIASVLRCSALRLFTRYDFCRSSLTCDPLFCFFSAKPVLVPIPL